MKKKCHQQKHFIFNLTIVSENVIQIGSLVTDIQNFGDDIRLRLHNNLLQKV